MVDFLIHSCIWPWWIMVHVCRSMLTLLGCTFGLGYSATLIKNPDACIMLSIQGIIYCMHGVSLNFIQRLLVHKFLFTSVGVVVAPVKTSLQHWAQGSAVASSIDDGEVSVIPLSSCYSFQHYRSYCRRQEKYGLWCIEPKSRPHYTHEKKGGTS